MAWRASRIDRTCLRVQYVTRSQDRVILTRMTLRGRDVSDPALPMLVVVPAHERDHPFAGRLQIRKAVVRELGSILGGAEQAFGKGIVCAL